MDRKLFFPILFRCSFAVAIQQHNPHIDTVAASPATRTHQTFNSCANNISPCRQYAVQNKFFTVRFSYLLYLPSYSKQALYFLRSFTFIYARKKSLFSAGFGYPQFLEKKNIFSSFNHFSLGFFFKNYSYFYRPPHFHFFFFF